MPKAEQYKAINNAYLFRVGQQTLFFYLTSCVFIHCYQVHQFQKNEPEYAGLPPVYDAMRVLEDEYWWQIAMQPSKATVQKHLLPCNAGHFGGPGYFFYLYRQSSLHGMLYTQYVSSYACTLNMYQIHSFFNITIESQMNINLVMRTSVVLKALGIMQKRLFLRL